MFCLAVSPSTGLFHCLQWYHGIAICLFIWGSYHQHICHKILAKLRLREKELRSQKKIVLFYGQPNGDWFKLVSSPHFLAEIIIYSAMLLCFVVTNYFTCWWLVMIYLVSTLSLSARQTHSWYKSNFRSYPARRYALIPQLF